ncbi:MAG: hypothetical protein AAF587_30640 [Bacteroidota bacterium]
MRWPEKIRARHEILQSSSSEHEMSAYLIVIQPFTPDRTINYWQVSLAELQKKSNSKLVFIHIDFPFGIVYIRNIYLVILLSSL